MHLFFIQIPACLELLQTLPLQQAECYAHELVTWLCDILEEEDMDNEVWIDELSLFIFKKIVIDAAELQFVTKQYARIRQDITSRYVVKLCEDVDRTCEICIDL